MAQATQDPAQEDTGEVDAFRDELDKLPTIEPDRALPSSFRRGVYDKPGNQPSSEPTIGNNAGGSKKDAGKEDEDDSLYNASGGQSSHENQVGSGFRTLTSAPHRNLSSFVLARKKRLAGGLAAVVAAGTLAAVSFFSGPLQFMHLSHILQRNNSGGEKTSSIRVNGLFRYAKSGSIGETRVSYLGSKYFGSTVDRLGKVGIEFHPNKFGYLDSMTIDTEKLKANYPELNNMSDAEQRSFLADKFGVSEAELVKLKGVGGNKFALNTRNYGVKASRALVGNTLDTLDNGKIVTAIRGRVVTKYFDIPSLFHPYERAKANLEKKITGKLDRTARENAEKERLKDVAKSAESPKAVDARVNLKKALKGNEGKISTFLVAQAGLCAIRTIATDAITFNRAAIVVPSTLQAADKIAIGEQIQSNQDFTASQLNNTASTFTDSSGKSIWDSPALQATGATAGAITSNQDLSVGYAQAFSGDTTADNIKSYVKLPAADAVCSTPGQIIGAVGGIAALILAAPTGSSSIAFYAAAKGAELAATGGIVYLLQQQLTPLIQDKSVVPDVLSGPLGGNLMAYGARELANINGRSSGGVPLSGTETSTVTYDEQKQEVEQFKAKNVLAKIFDVKDYRSISGRLVDKASPSVTQNITKTASAILNFKTVLGTLGSMFSHKVSAATQPYDWHFARYGIPDNVAQDQRFEDPYANAEYVAHNILDVGASDSHGKSFIDKAKSCFGVVISRDSNNPWQVIPSEDVNPGSTDYTSSHCNDSDDNWHRLMLFVFDSRTMDAAACYAGDGPSCANTGLNLPTASTTTATPTTSAPGSLPTGSGQQLAAQLKQFVDQGKIKCTTSGCPDIANTASGTSIRGGQGCQVDALNPSMMGMLVELVNMGHTFTLSALCSDHHDDGLRGHAGGRAADFNTIDGVFMGPSETEPWSAAKVAAGQKLDQDIASFMPPSTGFGQIQCHPTFDFLSAFSTFNDGCHHQHLQVEM